MMEIIATWPFMVLILVVLGLLSMLALPCVGSAIGVSHVGNALIGCMKKNPDMYGKGLIITALPSTQGLYGFAAFFLFLLKLKDIATLSYMQAILIFAAGVSLGLAGYFSTQYQAKIACNGLVEMSNGKELFAQTIILTVYSELYAILTFALCFLVWVMAL